MDMFSKTFDDLIDFGYFLNALSYIFPNTVHGETEEIDKSDAARFYAFVIRCFTDQHNKFRELLFSFFVSGYEDSYVMKSRVSIQQILNLVEKDTSLELFRKRIQDMLQKWYVKSIRIPYLVSIGYSGKKLTYKLKRKGNNERQSLTSSSGLRRRENNKEIETIDNSDKLQQNPLTKYHNKADNVTNCSPHIRPKFRRRKRSPGTKSLPTTPSGNRKRSTPDQHQVESSEFDASFQDKKNVETPTKKKLFTEEDPNVFDFSCEKSDDDGEEEKDNDDTESKAIVVLSDVPEKIDIEKERVRRENTLNSTNNLPVIKRHKRSKFTDEEKAAIKHGYEMFGNQNYQWRKIKNYYDSILKNRTTVQIKDCARTMIKNRDL